MTLDPTNFSNFVLVLTAWGGAFLAALWLSLIVWTYRDIRNRARDPLARILAVLVVTVLFLPGIVIYLIIRPQRTLEDEYQYTLEEEALLQSIEDVPVCPGCGRHTKPPWKICPNCHTRLKKACHQCGELMELPWNLCPFCGAPTPGKRRDNISMSEALESLSGLSLNEPESSLDLDLDGDDTLSIDVINEEFDLHQDTGESEMGNDEYEE
jgi:RNA polymerase subunit RPABC4/transcription elongation factor Spt4